MSLIIAAGTSPVSITLVVLTWVCFLILFSVLYKFAFKPILGALEDREVKIKQSLDDAEQARAQLEHIEQTRDQIIEEANEEAKQILQQARKGAEDQAKTIKDKAKGEALILLENAQRDIDEKENQARAKIRQEAAELAIGLASKVIGENLDDEKNRKLTEKLISEI